MLSGQRIVPIREKEKENQEGWNGRSHKGYSGLNGILDKITPHCNILFQDPLAILKHPEWATTFSFLQAFQKCPDFEMYSFPKHHSCSFIQIFEGFCFSPENHNQKIQRKKQLL